MSEKRIKKRYRAQLPVLFDASELSRTGMTENVSEGGIFIRTAVTHPRNTLLKIELTMPDREKVVFIGKVRWVRRVSSGVRRLGSESGMGIQIERFLSGMGLYVALCERMNKD